MRTSSKPMRQSTRAIPAALSSAARARWINTAIVGSEGNIDIGFAIPVNMAGGLTDIS
jgi:S1-C subfamily serine protease